MYAASLVFPDLCTVKLLIARGLLTLCNLIVVLPWHSLYSCKICDFAVLADVTFYFCCTAVLIFVNTNY